MAKPMSKVLCQQRLPFAKAQDRKRISSSFAHQHVTVSKRRTPGEVWIENSLYPSGISNPANNCWANAVLQCMLNNSLFMEVISEQILSHPASCSINCNHSGSICVIAAIRRMVHSYSYSLQSTSISPFPIQACLQDISPRLKWGKQNDAHEFFLALVQTLLPTTDIRSRRDTIKDLFVEVSQKVSCTSCDHGATQKQVTSCLQLYPQDKQAYNIQDLLSENFDEEIVMAYCERCNKNVKKEKCLEISSHPKFLCIHIAERSKKEPQVQVQKASLKLPGCINHYRLTGVIIYRQRTKTSGHYTAFVCSRKDGQWFYTNDAQIMPVSVATVLQQRPFMLFYQKEDAHSPVLPLRAIRPLITGWLNDELMDTYMTLVVNEASKVGKLVHTFGSQFVWKYQQKGYEGVQRWYKSVDMLQQDMLLYVINDGGYHWTLLVMDMKKKSVEYYDSYRGSGHRYLRLAVAYLDSRLSHLNKDPINWKQWNYFDIKNIPQQTNGIDCGVFVCQYALYRVREKQMKFQQEDMGIIRKIVLEEVLSGRLMSTNERDDLINQRLPGCCSEYYNTSFIEPPLSKSLHRKDIPMTITSQSNIRQSQNIHVDEISICKRKDHDIHHLSTPFSKPTEGVSKLSTREHTEEDIPSSPQSPPFSPIKQTTNPSPALNTPSPTHDRPNNLSKALPLLSAHYCRPDEHSLTLPVLSAHSRNHSPPSPALPEHSSHSHSTDKPNYSSPTLPMLSVHSHSADEHSPLSPSLALPEHSAHSHDTDKTNHPSNGLPLLSSHSHSPDEYSPPSLALPEHSAHSHGTDKTNHPSNGLPLLSSHSHSPDEYSPALPEHLAHSDGTDKLNHPSPALLLLSDHSHNPDEHSPLSPSPALPEHSAHSHGMDRTNYPSHGLMPLLSSHSHSLDEHRPPPVHSSPSSVVSAHSHRTDKPNHPSPALPVHSAHSHSTDKNNNTSHAHSHSSDEHSPPSPVLATHSHSMDKPNHPSSALTVLSHGTDKPDQPCKMKEQFSSLQLNKILSQPQLPLPLMEIFPPKYQYMFESFETKSDSVLSFSAVLRISITTQEEAIKWITDLECHTSTTYRVTRGNTCKGKRIVFKTDRHCQHKRKKLTTKQKEKGKKRMSLSRDKKTDCPTHFTLKLHAKQSVKLQCELSIHWEHNHSIQSAHALSFRPLSEKTINNFEEYFKQGHSPSSALHLHGLNLAIEYEGREDQLEKVSADRSLTPLPMDVYYLYRKWRTKNHGEECGEKMFDKLEEVVSTYNKEHNAAGGRALLQRYDKEHTESTWDTIANVCTEQPLVLAICTPLMSRAHDLLRQAGELVYCDSTASLDRYNCPTFIFSTCSSAGGIPLGIVITSGESEGVLTEAFSLLKKVLPQRAFYGQGDKGPQLCLTDDCDAERGALKNNWSRITLLLCVFHFLQSWWTWLWDRKHGIVKEDRQPIIYIVKKLVYAPTESDLVLRYNNLMKQTAPESYVTKYPQLAKRLQQFWERRSEWAISYRLDFMTRGNHTNNYAEAGMRVLKEIVFGRVKAYNLVQMFQFVTTTMEAYFTNRLLDLAHSRYRPGVALRYKEVDTTNMDVKEVKQCRQSIYAIKVQLKEIGELEYTIDMELGICSCPKGATGAACKHQAIVAKQFNIASINLPPIHSKEARMQYAVLATGKAMDPEFYAHLTEATQCTLKTTVDPKQDVHVGDSVFSYEMNKDAKRTFEDGDMSTEVHGTDDPWQEQLVNFRESLNEVVQDMMCRLECGDHNMISGVSAFVRTYRKMMKTAPAPTASIAYALNNFGKVDRFAWSNGRKGKYIRTNSGGIQRRRKGLPRGTKMAPQGRPTKRKLQDPQAIPPKAKRQKRPHSLTVLFNTT